MERADIRTLLVISHALAKGPANINREINTNVLDRYLSIVALGRCLRLCSFECFFVQSFKMDVMKALFPQRGGDAEIIPARKTEETLQ